MRKFTGLAVLVWFLILDCSWALAQCVPSAGYPWSPGECLNAVDLNSALSGKAASLAPVVTEPLGASSSFLINQLGTTKQAAGNSGMLLGPISDWLLPYINYITPNTTFAVESTPVKPLGLLGAARLSDGGAANPSRAALGNSGVCVNDSAGAGGCWAFYGETVVTTAASGSVGLATELDIDDFGTPVTPNPYSLNTAARSVDIWLAAGGGHPMLGSAASLALGITNNGQPFLGGIAFNKGSLFGDDGTSGTAAALLLAKGHQIEWFAPDQGVAATIVSTAATSSSPVTLAFGSGSVTATGGTLGAAPIAYAALPTCNSGAEGSVIPVTNSSTNVWGGQIDGNGTGVNHVLAYCNGSHWTVAAK